MRNWRDADVEKMGINEEQRGGEREAYQALPAVILSSR